MYGNRVWKYYSQRREMSHKTGHKEGAIILYPKLFDGCSFMVFQCINRNARLKNLRIYRVRSFSYSVQFGINLCRIGWVVATNAGCYIIRDRRFEWEISRNFASISSQTFEIHTNFFDN